MTYTEVCKGCTSLSEMLCYVIVREQNQVLGVEHIASLSELSVTTVKRCVKSLTDRGLIIKHPQGYYYDSEVVFEPTPEEDTWYDLLALKVFTFLKSVGLLDKALVRKEIQTVEQWGRVLDQLVRLDGHSQEDVENVMNWVCDEDNWWIRTENIQSLAGLRRVRDDQSKFSKLLVSYNRDKKTKPIKPSVNPLTDPSRKKRW